MQQLPPMEGEKSAESFSIRPAGAQDDEPVSALFIEQMREHHIARQAEEMRTVVRAVRADGQLGFILVAQAESVLAGAAYFAMIMSAEHGGKIGWVEEIYVVPSHRGRGIGTALLQSGIARARQLHWRALELEVDVEHCRAEALYQRIGFAALPRSRWVLPL